MNGLQEWGDFIVDSQFSVTLQGEHDLTEVLSANDAQHRLSVTCLEGTGEFDEDETAGLDAWLREDPSTSSSSLETDSPPALYEQSLDCLACAMGGKSILPPAFQYIPSMMCARGAHASITTYQVMQKELQTVVDMMTPMFNDSHPRARYAACRGQLCMDLEEIIQRRFQRNLFAVLIPALEDPEPRVHAHAASALITFCEGVERDTLLLYLNPIVERLLTLLNPPGDHTQVRRYVQEQAIMTLAIVADASEVTFAKHYPMIMPLLLSVLRNADGPDYWKLRVKAMECAGLIESPVDPNDTQLGHHLMATWSKICQAVGSEFEAYLPVVMPSLLATASAKADLSVYEDDGALEEREGRETIVMDGHTYGVRTSAMDEKCQAFETLVIYCPTLDARFAPYLSQTLEVTLLYLRFYFHEGVHEACAMLIPMLLACGKQSGALTNQMVSATFLQLIDCISTEHDSTFLALLYKYFSEALGVIGGPEALSAQFHVGIIEAAKRQLHVLADKCKARAARVTSNAVDFNREQGRDGARGGDGSLENTIVITLPNALHIRIKHTW
ncbi:armadillo-type protein [Flammula alnicola]|nr:armadillo-type protein [Flammula alnicola]